MIARNATTIGLCLGVAVGAAAPAAAETIGWPRLVWGGELEIQVQSDTNFAARDRKGYNVAFTKTEGTFYLNVGENLSFHTKVTLDQVRDRFRTGFFQDEGLFVEKLYAQYDFAPVVPVALYGGKFTPNFGRGFDLAPGIYGDEISKDYEMTERVGFGIAVGLPVDFGKHTVRAEVFMADTSFLSTSLITRPSADDPLSLRVGRNRLRYGGPSNTGQLTSTVISLSGEKMPGLGDLKYWAAFSYQSPGQPHDAVPGDPLLRVETGAAFGLTWEELPITDRLSVTPFVEYIRYWHAGGSFADANYLTAALEFKYYAWKLSTVYMWRAFEGGDEPNGRTHIATASLTYDLSNLKIGDFRFKNFEVSVAYKAAREEDQVWRHTLGTQLVYLLKF
ncbi:MAG: hypothetical protein KIT16_13740 [Rhodospirillaceae bacterium]|nr:hypothetical protein [Rhodospirillaceae bacterium]